MNKKLQKIINDPNLSIQEKIIRVKEYRKNFKNQTEKDISKIKKWIGI